MRLCGTVRALCALFVAVATQYSVGARTLGSAAAVRYKQDNSSDFIVVIVRHGERFADKSITGLAPAGLARASYIARCASSGQPSSALPFGLPTTVAASTVRPGESTRPRDTMAPLAAALGVPLNLTVDKEDFKGFAQLVRNSIRPRGSFIAAWQHSDIPYLLEALGIPNADQFSKWPTSCDSASWKEPPYISPSNACYDAVWQTRFSRSEGGEWTAGPATSLHEGFGGAAGSPCAQGFKPLP